MLVVGGSGWVLYERALDSLESQMSRHLMAEARLLANAIGDTQVLIAMRPGHEGFTFYRNFKARIQKAKGTRWCAAHFRLRPGLQESARHGAGDIDRPCLSGAQIPGSHGNRAGLARRGCRHDPF